MGQPEVATEQLEALMETGDNLQQLNAAKELFAREIFGNPEGIYLVKGGKAALRLAKNQDAALLLYFAVKMVKPRTMLWAEAIVNRAVACINTGYYHDALVAGLEYLQALASLPMGAVKVLPYAHHAVGQAYDALKEHSKAVPHHRMAMTAYNDPLMQAGSRCNLATALAQSGGVAEAEAVLLELPASELPKELVATYHMSHAIVLFHMERYQEALDAGWRANRVLEEQENPSQDAVAELHYWMSRSAWELGDRHTALGLGLSAAMTSDLHWNAVISDKANQWVFKMAKGGVQGA